VLVVATLFLLQSAQLPQKHLVEELRITSPGSGEFVAVGSVTETAGAIYLSDWREPAIYRFDPQGRFVGRVGREGDGPGEYRVPITLGARGDSLWLWEPSQQRLTLWDPAGHLVRTTAVTDGGGSYASGVLLPDGGIAKLPNWSSANGSAGQVSAPVLRFTPAGRLRDTLLTIPVGVDHFQFETGPKMYLIGQQPFIDSPLLVASIVGDGFIRVDRATDGPPRIGLTRYDASGRVRWRRSISYTPAPLDPTVIDSVIRGYTNPADSRAPKVPEATVRAGITIPPRAVPVLSVTLGTDGRIWLRMPTPAGAPAHYMVLGSNGAPAFDLLLPPRGRILGSPGPKLWVLLSDDDDLPIAVRYRVE